MSGWYDIGKEELLARVIPPEAGVWICGVNTDYVFNEGQTEFSLLEPYIILPAQELTSVTYTGGLLEADDVMWIAAGAGAAPEDNVTIQGVIIFFALDDAATLLAFIDSPSLGLPLTLKGVNVELHWNLNPAEPGILEL